MIETTDLILDQGRTDDWRAMYENVWRHEATARYMRWSAAQTELQGYRLTQRLLAFQSANPTAYLVYEKPGRLPIGYAGVKEIQPGVFEDAGIAVGPSYTGAGYGRQILCALLHQVFEELGGRRLIYSCWAENVPSNRLARSVGLRFSHSEEHIDHRSGHPFLMHYYER